MRRGEVAWASPVRVGALVAALLLTGACSTSNGPEVPVTSEATSSGSVPDSSATPDGPSTPTPSQPADAPAVDLTITLDETGEGSTQTFTLTCGPAGGDHPDPEAACAALVQAGGVAAMAPRSPDEMCTQVYGGPAVATVQGTIDGAEVRATFDRSNGCEISRWDALAPLLGSTGGGL